MKKKSKKTHSSLEIEYRNQPYYGSYKYKVVIPIPDIHRLRYYDSYQEYISYHRNTSYWGGLYTQTNKELSNKDEIERYFAWKDSVSGTIDQKFRMEGDKISVFSNELVYLKDVVSRIKPESKKIRYCEAYSPTEPDIMYFSKKPKHNYRVYFKSLLVDQSTRDTIRNFVNDNAANGVEVCDSMKIWLVSGPFFRKDGSAYMRPGFFIDYDEASYEMAIRLMFGELLKSQVYKLLQRPSQ